MLTVRVRDAMLIAGDGRESVRLMGAPLLPIDEVGGRT